MVVEEIAAGGMTESEMVESEMAVEKMVAVETEVGKVAVLVKTQFFVP